MGTKVDEQIVRCLGQLRMPQFAPLLDYLKAIRADRLEMMAIATDATAIHRLQGKAEELKELLEHIEKSDVLLAKIKR